MPKPRILLYDVENSPSLGWYYDRWKKGGGNIIADEQEWFMLSFAYKWLDEPKTHVRGLPDYPGYRRNKKCDRALVRELGALVSQADITIAHNGDRHDLPKLNARLAYHGLPPCNPLKQIDTYKAARKYFKFTSNSLGNLAQHFGLGDKLPHTGFDLWRRCMDGDMQAWPELLKYNSWDVTLLEGCYLRIRPFMASGHPNLTHWSCEDTCPVCESADIKKTGLAYIATGAKQRYTCRACGHRFVTRQIMKTTN